MLRRRIAFRRRPRRCRQQGAASLLRGSCLEGSDRGPRTSLFSAFLLQPALGLRAEAEGCCLVFVAGLVA